MTLKVLDTVVLLNDFASQRVRAGDIGTVVEVYQPDGLEVEFVSGTGKTVALLTIKTTDVRAVSDSDMFAVRPMKAA